MKNRTNIRIKTINKVYLANTAKIHKTSRVVPSYTSGVQICAGNADNLKKTANMTRVKPTDSSRFESPI